MNVILVSLDSLREDSLGCYGNWAVRTPHMDALAEGGALCRNAIVQTPYTIPSHATMLTGLYPFSHGLRKQFGRKMAPQARTIFVTLKEHGYQTATFLGANVLGREHGYRDWRRLGPPQIDRICQTLETLPQPFFMFIHYWDIHVPYRVQVPVRSGRDWVGNAVLQIEDRGLRLPDSLRRRLLPSKGPVCLERIRRVAEMLQSGQKDAVLAGYYGAVEWADRFVGCLVDCLQAQSLFDDTLLVITSDHGDSFNEHDEIARAPQYPNAYVHGHFLYDNVLKVPLIFHCPSTLSQRVIDEQVEIVDLVPTIYDLLGLPLDSPPGCFGLEGVSLRGLLTKEGESHPKQYAYSETLLRDSHSLTVRSRRYKLIWDVKQNEYLLFDLEADPGELDDISAQEPEVVALLLEELSRIQSTAQQSDSDEDTAMSDEDHELVHQRLEALGYV